MASGLICNINGIPPHERARYGQLVEALRHAIQIQKMRESPYEVTLGPGCPSLRVLARRSLAGWSRIRHSVMNVAQIKNDLASDLASRIGSRRSVAIRQ